MFYQYITAADVAYRHEAIRRQFADSQRIVSIRGLREIVGTMFIQVGSHIHGRAQSAYRDAANTRNLVLESRLPCRTS